MEIGQIVKTGHQLIAADQSDFSHIISFYHWKYDTKIFLTSLDF